MAGSYQVNSKIMNVPTDSFEVHSQRVREGSEGNEGTHQDLSICNAQENCARSTIAVKPLPSIEGIITNSANSENFDQGRECINNIYNFVDRNSCNATVKDDLLTRSSELFDKTDVSQQSCNLNWDRCKITSQQTVANTSYGLVTHVLEQHFGYKEEEFIESESAEKNSNYHSAIYESEEPQVLSTESKSYAPSLSYDSDSSSSESTSGLVDYSLYTHDDSEKSRYIKCSQCEVYLRSKGNVKVHMRLHSNFYPYVCKDCGNSFPSCNALFDHRTNHESTTTKSFSCSDCGHLFNCEKHFKIHRKKHLASRMFNCTECKQSFATKDRLFRHSKFHFGDTSYFCHLCGTAFGNKMKYDEHKEMHSKSIWKCEDCDDGCTFDGPVLLEKHILSVHNITDNAEEVMQPIQLSPSESDKRFACEICALKFEKISEYYVHRCNHTHSAEKFKCGTCAAEFLKEFHLFVHTAVHNSVSFSCNVCRLSFKTKKSLHVHMQKNDHKLPFVCSHCDLSFKEENNLKSHMRTHNGEKPFSCEQCQATFRHSSTLKMHQRIHTEHNPYICSVCGSSFIQNNHLQVHLRSHSTNKPYKCSDCEASFTKKDYLLAHKLKHRNNIVEFSSSVSTDPHSVPGGSGLRCTYCNMTFSHQSTLSAHVRKHTGERPFVCDKCGASFLYSSNLMTHRRKHTGERPYKCKECDSSFTLKSYLTMHLRKHSGERPFKCDICDSSFTQKTHLSTHRRIHTGEYPYKCDICGDAFRDGANFWRHKKRHLDELNKTKGSDSGNSTGIRKSKVKRLRTRHSGGQEFDSEKLCLSGQLDREQKDNSGLGETENMTFIDLNVQPFGHSVAAVKTETL